APGGHGSCTEIALFEDLAIHPCAEFGTLFQPAQSSGTLGGKHARSKCSTLQCTATTGVTADADSEGLGGCGLPAWKAHRDVFRYSHVGCRPLHRADASAIRS